MRQSNPPRLATWMLEHLTPTGRNDALAGDLLEEFRSGRSAIWYWRQVLACISIANTRVVTAYLGALLFACVWALLAPDWVPLTRPGKSPYLDHAILSLAWPWSTICELGLSFLILISFVWAGLLLYTLLESLATRHFNFRRLRSGLSRSAAVFAPLYVGFRSLTLIFPGSGIRLARSAVHDPFPLSTLARPVSIVICAPFFLTLLWAIWDASCIKSSRKHATHDRPGRQA
jgi:hypothetical protein